MKKQFAFILFFILAFTSSAFAQQPRPEYPRPQFERKEWINLNGEWSYQFDFVGEGVEKKLYDSKGFEGKISVPFAPESELSGVKYTDFINHIWYQRDIQIPSEWSDRNVILNFQAVYYFSEVYIDGSLAGRHFGGSTGFAIDITRFVSDAKSHSLVVHAYSDTRTQKQSAGKQNVRHTPFECMYTRTTGIWQTVWMEPVDEKGIKGTHVVPDIDQQQVVVHPQFYAQDGGTLTVSMFDGKKLVAKRTAPANDASVIVLQLKNQKLWSPESPFLYDLVYEVTDAEGKVVDEVYSYVGMRKFHCSGNKTYLNNQPFYQRLVLDQGFYPDGIWTAPSDEALKHDIELSMQAGFNGARLHQKVFEERFHYWADKLGYITWGEAPSWGMNTNDPEVARNFITEWSEEVVRDRNHPSIVTWTPMNEEFWPDRVQYPRFVCDLYDITKLLDPTRPFHDVSGGVHVKTDIYTTHNYEQDPKRLIDDVYKDGKWMQAPHSAIDLYWTNVGYNRPTDVNIYDYPSYESPSMPYILDEFGGIKWVKGQDKNTGNSQVSWGYGEPPHSLEEFYSRLESMVDGLMGISENVWGYCYTQLTDVEQEQNGIYFYDRSCKFDMKRIHSIFSKKPHLSE